MRKLIFVVAVATLQAALILDCGGALAEGNSGAAVSATPSGNGSSDLNAGTSQGGAPSGPGAAPTPAGSSDPLDAGGGGDQGSGHQLSDCTGAASWSYPDGRPYATKVVDGVTYLLVVHGKLSDGCGYLNSEWVPKLDGRDLVPDASDEIRARLVTPPVKFEHLDPVHGWFYVNTPMDFRLGVVEPVTATASASNILGTVWVTVTATPTWVTFYAGEPGAKPVGCSPAGAAAPYVIERPGECAYTYRNSSAISANGRTFDTTTTLTWTITYTSSDGPGSIPDVVTTSTSPLAIAEVQALVTCTGPLPAQGGC